VIDGWIEIHGTRVRVQDDQLLRLELIQEYGFVADGLTADIDYFVARDHFPFLITARFRDRVPVRAALEVGEDFVYFSGYLEEPAGVLSRQRVEPGRINMTARSSLALLLDELPDNRLTEHWRDADCGQVVRDVVKKRGFDARLVQATGVMAGESLEAGGTLYSVDDELPGAVIEAMVGQTGFIANTTAKQEFYFIRQAAPPAAVPPILHMDPGDPTSQVVEAQFTSGEITNLSLYEAVRVPPGYPLTIMVEGDEDMSGRYYSTRSRHQGSVVPNENLSEFNVARKLPDLSRTEDET
jgi:hypothetical protein